MLTAQLGNQNSYLENIQLGIADCSDDFTSQLGTLNSYPGNIILGIEDTCPAQIGAGTFTYTLTASNTLVISESAARTTVLNLSPNNAIAFSEKIAKGAVAFNVLSFNSQAVGFSGNPAVNTLVLSQSVSYSATFVRLVNAPFSSMYQWTVFGGTYNLTPSNAYSPLQTLARITTLNVTVSNNFGPSQSNEAYEQYDIDQTLVMSQTSVTTKDNDSLIVQSLVFMQDASYTAAFNATVSNQIDFVGGFTKVSEIAALSITIPEVQVTKVRGKVVLQAETGVVVLPRPILGDTENCEGTLLIKYAITGDVYTYIRRTDLRKLRYTFMLDRRKSLELLEFVKNFNFKPIVLNNWKGETWFGCLVTDPLELIPKSRWAPCNERVDVTFEFEGIKVN